MLLAIIGLRHSSLGLHTYHNELAGITTRNACVAYVHLPRCKTRQ